VALAVKVALAHHGMFFLDELLGFWRHVLEVLCQPLEKRITRIQSPIPSRPYSVGHVGSPVRVDHISARHAFLKLSSFA
jgi:Magnesium chelatase, subunit ChlI